jgi:hypothetical protein
MWGKAPRPCPGKGMEEIEMEESHETAHYGTHVYYITPMAVNKISCTKLLN